MPETTTVGAMESPGAPVRAPQAALHHLYELPLAYRAFDADLLDAEGELTPELLERLEELEAFGERKVDAIGVLVRERMLLAETKRAEAKRLTREAQALENGAANLKNYLLRTLQALGWTRLAGRRFTARIQRNGQPTVRWTSTGEPPEGFRRVTVELDREAALAAWNAGRALPDGVDVVYGEHLRIA